MLENQKRLLVVDDEAVVFECVPRARAIRPTMRIKREAENAFQ